MSTCATCKHWGTGAARLTEDGGRGQWRYCEKLSDAVSVVCDCSYEYSADTELSTQAEFGCNEWEAK